MSRKAFYFKILVQVLEVFSIGIFKEGTTKLREVTIRIDKIGQFTPRQLLSNHPISNCVN